MSLVAFRTASAFTSAILSARCGAFRSITGLNHSTILRPPFCILPFAVRVTMGPLFSHPRPTPLCTKMPWRSNENEMVSISPKDCFVDGLMLFTSFPSCRCLVPVPRVIKGCVLPNLNQEALLLSSRFTPGIQLRTTAFCFLTSSLLSDIMVILKMNRSRNLVWGRASGQD